MFNFPGGFSEKLPADVAARSGQDMVCEGPSQSPKGRDFLLVPGTTAEQAAEILAEISRQLGSNQSSVYIGAGLIGPMAQYPNELRKLYYASLANVHAAWIADGRKVTQNVADQIIHLRKIIREANRSQSSIPTFVYDVIDLARDNGAPKHEILYSEGKYAEVIDSAFRPNEKWTRKTLVLAKAGTYLKVGSTVLLVVDMTAAGAAIYLAKSEEEQQRALEKFGADAGAAAGFEAGAYLCIALSLTLNVAGIVACGVLVGGLGFAGKQAGAALLGGQQANDIVSKLKSQ